MQMAWLGKILHGRTSRLSNVHVHFTLLPVEISVGGTIGQPPGEINQIIKFSNIPEYRREALIIRKKKARKSIISVLCGGSSFQGFFPMGPMGLVRHRATGT